MNNPESTRGPLETREGLFRPILTYADAIDSKRFELFADVFHPDAVIDLGFGNVRKSLPVITKSMADAHIGLIGSQHRLSNFFVDETDEEMASTRTFVDALLVGGPTDKPLTYRDVGTYHDHLVASGGRWVIASRKYQSLWCEGDHTAIMS